MQDNQEAKKPIINVPEGPVDFLFEKMLKNFIKTVQKTGILQEVKDRRYYVKPSEKKRLASKSKQRRNK